MVFTLFVDDKPVYDLVEVPAELFDRITKDAPDAKGWPVFITRTDAPNSERIWPDFGPDITMSAAILCGKQ